VFVKLVYGLKPSKLNPQLCNTCEQFASQNQGGAEIELSLLFADVRGSTNLAEGMSAKEYSQLINRFYNTATQIMVRTDALIDKIIGDQVVGIYVPGFAGPKHARRAIEAAQELLHATGHVRYEKPWIPIGAGVHTGTAFVGSVGSEGGTSDITVLGDAANTTARLASSALTGEILISEAAYSASGLDFGQIEKRYLELKGKSYPVPVHVLTDFS
jgi:adenylate cyclase